MFDLLVIVYRAHVRNPSDYNRGRFTGALAMYQMANPTVHPDWIEACLREQVTTKAKA